MSRRRPWVTFAAVLGLLAALAQLRAITDARAAPVPAPGFVDEVVISGLTRPTDLEFASDGTVFVGEQNGIIKRFAALESPPSVYADLQEEVLDNGGRGLNGIALDPDFPTSPNVYALYALDQAPGQPLAIPFYDDTCASPCPSMARLSRFTGTDVATSQTVLLDGWCLLTDKHGIADVEVGGDGALYVSSGDSATEQYADIGQTDDPCGDPVGEGGALRAQDLRTSGDPVGLSATILRLDATTGAAAAGNPASASSDPNTRRVVAYGARNPWRIAPRPGTTAVYVADNGWRTTDELNVVDVANATVANFGWPCYEGAALHVAFAATGICSNLPRNALTDPRFSYQHTDPPFAGSGCRPRGTSITGLAFVGTNSYPARLHNALFLADFARGCISAVRVSPDGQPNFSTMEDVVLDAERPIDLEIGPDGDVFYLDYLGGTVHRIRWTGPSDPAPTPAFTSVTPTRIYDTRPGAAINTNGTKPTANTTRTITIAGRGGVPTTGAAAVAINITGTEAEQPTFITAWPNGTRPNASNLNLTPNQTTANTVIVPLAPNGTIQLYTSGTTHLLIDVIAWIPA